MKLSEVKAILPTLNDLPIRLEDGTFVPDHFHITEVGMVTKRFIDCGGTVREEKSVSFQLWSSYDYHHRLKPSKLLNIIELSETRLGIEDAEVEVEYQSGTIGRYALDFDGENFVLKNKSTACLALDKCGIPDYGQVKNAVKRKLNLSKLTDKQEACCAPESGCC